MVLAPAIIFAYVRLARREEVGLIKQFGGAYRAYQRDVPMFVPRWQVVRKALATM